MLKGLGDLGNLMKMQKEFKNMQKKITGTKMDGKSKDGMVSAVVTGDYKIVNLTIDEGLARSGDKGKMEKTIVDALNNAIENVKEYSASEMSKLTGGLNIPGMGDMFK